MPFIKITKAEYLDKLAGAVERRSRRGNDGRDEELAGGQHQDEGTRGRGRQVHEAAGRILESTRPKYQNRLNETAEVPSLQPSALLENKPDIFDEQRASAASIPGVQDRPGDGGTGEDRQPSVDPRVVGWRDRTSRVGKQLSDAILNNFDFDYLYNYFFDPAKVKGQPYKPLRYPLARGDSGRDDGGVGRRKSHAANPASTSLTTFPRRLPGRNPSAGRVRSQASSRSWTACPATGPSWPATCQCADAQPLAEATPARLHAEL